MELFDYQVDLYNQLKDKPNWALFVTPGAGKTLVSLEILKYQKHEHIIILCRKNKIKEWQEDAADMDAEIIITNFESIHKLKDLIDSAIKKEKQK